MPAPEIVTSLTPPSDADRLAEAEAMVRDYCRWHIAPVRPDDTATFRSVGGPVWLLPSLRVTAVASVTVDGVAVTGFTWTPNGVLVAPGWTWDGTSGFASTSDYPGGWPPGQAVVTFTHGYDTVPAVARVIRTLATRSKTGGAYVQVGQVRAATDASGAPLGGALSASDIATLDAYRLPPRP